LQVKSSVYRPHGMKKGTPQKATPSGKPTQMAQAAQSDQIFTIKELSEHLRVHPTTIYRLLRQGRLPGFRVGSNWRFSREAIEQWERDQAGREAASPPRRRRAARRRR
jgi:excisionase family DNA binding protein